MVRLSGQHKFGLVFCGIFMVILGLGITSSGFVYDFLDPYDEVSKLKHADFSHTQYWLGVPLLLLGVYVIVTSCFQVRSMIVFGLVTTSLVIVLSIFAVILEGTWWRLVLGSAMIISDKDCEYIDGKCLCSGETGRSSEGMGLPCNDVKYLAVIYTFLVGFSALAIPVCFFTTFIYFRILGWMSHIGYDDLTNNSYGKAVNGHNGRGMVPANEVALGVYPQ